MTKKNKWWLNGGRGSGRTFRLLWETYENKIKELKKENEELKQQIEKMKSDITKNIKWADQNKNNQMYCKLNSMINQWEIKENG